MSSSLRLVSLRLAPGLFAVPLETVVEAVAMAELMPLPGAPRACLGLLNLHGDVMPVLEPMAWLSGELPSRGPEAWLLVVRVGARMVAFVADEVHGALELNFAQLMPPDPAVAGIPWLGGTFLRGDEPCVLIRLPALLASADAAGLEEAEQAFSRAQAREARP